MAERSRAARQRERLTDLYVITIFTVFLLFPGFSGYENITFSKYALLLGATGLWLAGAAWVSLRGRTGVGDVGPAQWAAWAFLAAATLSWAASPWRRESLLGAGRYDGLLTLACYVLSFLGVSLFTRPKPMHADALALGVTGCCAAGVLQLFGLNALGLFPGGLTFFDAGTLYSGAYLGTLGNTNILDAVLCLAQPLFLGLYVLEGGARYLLPLALGTFVQAYAGGSGAAVAYAACALAAGPLLLTSPPRLWRALRCGGVLLLAASAAALYAPDYTDRVLAPRFAPRPLGLALAAAGLALAAVSLAPPERVFRGAAPAGGTLRRFFLALDGAAALGGLAALWFWPGQTGTVYELSRALHGRLEDDFGSSRIRIWRGVLALVPERPLLGGGPGTLPLRLDIRFTRFVPETGQTLATFVDNAHSVYLGLLVNCGALGLLCALALGALALRSAWRSRDAGLTLPLALGALGGAVHGLFGLGLCLSEPFFWITLGLLCARGGEKETML